MLRTVGRFFLPWSGIWDEKTGGNVHVFPDFSDIIEKTNGGKVVVVQMTNDGHTKVVNHLISCRSLMWTPCCGAWLSSISKEDPTCSMWKAWLRWHSLPVELQNGIAWSPQEGGYGDTDWQEGRHCCKALSSQSTDSRSGWIEQTALMPVKQWKDIDFDSAWHGLGTVSQQNQITSWCRNCLKWC